MKRFLNFFIVLILFIQAPLVLWASEAIEQQAQLVLEGNGPWYELELDAMLQLQAGSEGLSDIRILDQDGKAQPYAFLISSNVKITELSAVHHETVQAELYPLRGSDPLNGYQSSITVNNTRAGTSISINNDDASASSNDALLGYIIDLKKVTYGIDQIDIVWTPSQDGFFPYRLEVSDDLMHWRLIENGQLYRLSNNNSEITKTSIAIKKTQGRFLRLMWVDRAKAPFITQAMISKMVVTETSLKPNLIWSNALEAKRILIDDPNHEIYELSFAAPHKLEVIKVNLPDGYSLAPFWLYGSKSNSRGNWIPLRQGMFYQLQGKNGELTRLDSVELPDGDFTAIRIEIDKRGGGLDLDALPMEIALVPNNLVFLARGKSPYAIQIGKSQQKSMELAFADLVPGAVDIDDPRISLAVLAEPLKNISKVPEIEKVDQFNWRQFVLWAVLILGVGFLVIIAFHLLRQSEQNKQ